MGTNIELVRFDEVPHPLQNLLDPIVHGFELALTYAYPTQAPGARHSRVSKEIVSALHVNFFQPEEDAVYIDRSGAAVKFSTRLRSVYPILLIGHRGSGKSTVIQKHLTSCVRPRDVDVLDDSCRTVETIYVNLDRDVLLLRKHETVCEHVFNRLMKRIERDRTVSDLFWAVVVSEMMATVEVLDPLHAPGTTNMSDLVDFWLLVERHGKSEAAKREILGKYNYHQLLFLLLRFMHRYCHHEVELIVDNIDDLAATVQVETAATLFSIHAACRGDRQILFDQILDREPTIAQDQTTIPFHCAIAVRVENESRILEKLNNSHLVATENIGSSAMSIEVRDDEFLVDFYDRRIRALELPSVRDAIVSELEASDQLQELLVHLKYRSAVELLDAAVGALRHLATPGIPDVTGKSYEASLREDLSRWCNYSLRKMSRVVAQLVRTLLMGTDPGISASSVFSDMPRNVTLLRTAFFRQFVLMDRGRRAVEYNRRPHIYSGRVASGKICHLHLRLLEMLDRTPGKSLSIGSILVMIERLDQRLGCNAELVHQALADLTGPLDRDDDGLVRSDTRTGTYPESRDATVQLTLYEAGRFLARNLCNTIEYLYWSALFADREDFDIWGDGRKTSRRHLQAMCFVLRLLSPISTS